MSLTLAESKQLTAVAVDAARQAGELLREYAHRPLLTRNKGEIDLVTEADERSEVLVRGVLDATGIPVLGEEGGLAEGGPNTVADADLLWIVDPIDGTTNFAHGHPHYAVSIGLWRRAPVTTAVAQRGHDVKAGKALLGVVHAPAANDFFVANGQGATLNDATLPVRESTPLNGSLLATGFPYDRRTNPDNNEAESSAMLHQCQGIRRMGAAALDLAWLAAGRIDGFWEMQLRPWDVAAGMALVQLTGCRVTDYGDHPWQLEHEQLLAAPAALHREMLTVIRRARAAANLPLSPDHCA